MSFRTRLTLFFVLIVILPMVAVAIVVSRLVGESETGKADARVNQGEVAAFSLYDDARRAADGALRAVGGDARLLAALRAHDLPAAGSRVRRLLRSTGAARIEVLLSGGRSLTAGEAAALAPRRTDLIAPGGQRLGRVELSVTAARRYVRRVERFTGFDARVTRGGRTLATTVTAKGGNFRTASFNAPDFGGRPVRVTVLLDADAATSSVHNDRLVLGAILLGFLLLSGAFALGVSRALGAQIGRFLHAARRIGEGDLGAEVPVHGRDEFSSLGQEFNKMSAQLAGRLEELRQERARLRTAILRTGEAAASGLDGDALLDNVVRTAVDGVQAGCGRALMRGPQRGPLEQRAGAGDPDGLEETLRRAEGRALDAGLPSEVSENGGAALAFPLRESAGDRRVLGIVSVARTGERFSDAERELFNSLAGQAARGVENVELHERVRYQAVHDELTGLANHRRFQELLDAELERARRFDQDTALVLLDIDNFKRVNDTWGHQQGDLVLQQVARVLVETSREIDEPARYGGEEMAVALPQTDLEGAFRLAERMRAAIEALAIPRPDGGVLEVTASFGVAAFPGSAVEKDELIAAADEALYEAKRAGKNRTVRAVRL